MELTGKAKKDFEKWYFEKQINREENKLLTNESKNVMAISNLSNFFPLLDNSMQYGVYVDFFDSVDMQIYVKPLSNLTWGVYVDHYGHHILADYVNCETRIDGRIEAIKKANGIYNSR